jgi:general secretion pathway protein A
MPALAARGAPVALEDMELLLPTLPTEMAPAWRELAQHPGLDWDLAAAPPCQPGATARWQCYRTKELSFPLLRQLDRPGVLVLQKTEDQPRYAVLDSLNDKTATLRWSGASHQVSLISLARFWRGEFATVWLPPAGYGANLREAEPSPVYGRLAQQLAQLEGAKAATGAPAAVKLDGALLARLKAFQKGQGIKADGVLGPMTFMQLDKALGVHSSNPVPENR